MPFWLLKRTGTPIVVDEVDWVESSLYASQNLMDPTESTRRTGNLVGLTNEREPEYFWSRVYGGEPYFDRIPSPDSEYRCLAHGKGDGIDTIDYFDLGAENKEDKQEGLDDEAILLGEVDSGLCADCTIGLDGKHRCTSGVDKHCLTVDEELTAQFEGRLNRHLPLKSSNKSAKGYYIREIEVSNQGVNGKNAGKWEVIDFFHGTKDELDRFPSELSGYTVVEQDSYTNTQTSKEGMECEHGDKKKGTSILGKAYRFLSCRYS